MNGLNEIDTEYDETLELRRKLQDAETELNDLYLASANNIRKAQYVFRCLRHVEFMVQKCPTCGAKRDEDGIIVHKKICYLADTLFGERK